MVETSNVNKIEARRSLRLLIEQKLLKKCNDLCIYCKKFMEH